jgi:hypothetical protein
LPLNDRNSCLGIDAAIGERRGHGREFGAGHERGTLTSVDVEGLERFAEATAAAGKQPGNRAVVQVARLLGLVDLRREGYEGSGEAALHVEDPRPAVLTIGGLDEAYGCDRPRIDQERERLGTVKLECQH